jgi:hypothetical protein
MGVRSSKLVWVCVLTLALFSAGASAAPPARPATVGLFAESLARQLGFQAGSAAEAREMLAAAGVTFGGSLDEPLTAHRAVGLLSDLGIDGQSSGDSSRLLSSGMTDRLAGLAAAGILGKSATPPPRPEGSVPASCTTGDRSQCFQCCLASIGPISPIPQRAIDLCNSSCTLLGQPPASTSTP